jgi:hypothetical protein
MLLMLNDDPILRKPSRETDEAIRAHDLSDIDAPS